MADETIAAAPPPARGRRRWLRVLAGAFAILMALLITFYFVCTSSQFFQKRILPRVSQSLNADITVSSAEIHPFSHIVLNDLRIQSSNQPPVLTAREVTAKYSLLRILRGDIRVDEMNLVSPVIQIVHNADGTSNLDPLNRASAKGGGKQAPSGKSSKPLRLDIRKLTLSNASVLNVHHQKVGTRDLVQLTNLDITLSDVKNGQPGKLQFAVIIRDENNPPAPAMYGLLEAKLDGNFDFTLTQDLKPSAVAGDARLEISQAAGSFGDFAKLNGALHCDIAPDEIKTINLNFDKSGAAMGELRANGPYNLLKSEGQLNVELLSVDKQVLNLIGAKIGFDFGSTKISSTNQINLSKSGAAISAVGLLSASRFQLSRTNQSTPPLDLRADYNVSVDSADEAALIKTLNLSGTQNGHPLLRAELASPMTLAWGRATNAVGDSSFNFTVSKLNLADWKTFLGSSASAGTVDMNVKLLSQRGGHRLFFDATNKVEDLAAQFGDVYLNDANVRLRIRGDATNFEQFNLSDYKLDISQSNQPALALSGAGDYDLANGNANLRLNLNATLQHLLALLGETNIIAASGTAELNARVMQTGHNQSVSGSFALTNFTGKVAANEFKDYSAMLDLNIEKTNDQAVLIHRVNGKVNEARNPGGDFEISGVYNLANKPTQLTVKLSGFNQNGLHPFLDPLLSGKTISSVLVNGTASVQRDPDGAANVKADLQVTNLVVNDPAGKFPSTPLEARVQLDAGTNHQIAEIRQFDVTLAPTARAKNQFRVQGRLDMSQSNSMRGNLKLSADSLDLTSYYDLFASTNKTVGRPNARGTPAKTNDVPVSVEVATTNEMPFRNVIVSADIREFYLHEIAATNLQATLKLNHTHATLKPLQLTLNGSPVNATADVDVTVPGYKYALTFNTTNVPFAPLWNTFEPDKKGEVGGTLSANVDIHGVGFSGEDLQKSLAGKFEIGTTNLNLAVNKIHNRILRLLVGAVAKLPEIAGNPIGAAGSLVGGAFGGGLSSQVQQSPIDVITLHGTAGDGKVAVNQAVVRSAVFEAGTTNGTITLAPILTNSTVNIPVSLALNRTLVSTPGVSLLVAPHAVTNDDRVQLRDFFSITGTFADPRPKINATAIGKDLIQKILPTVRSGINGPGGLLQPGTNQPLPRYWQKIY
jgi:uncharacterized protein involved in outer membrane biogenesis